MTDKRIQFVILSGVAASMLLMSAACRKKTDTGSPTSRPSLNGSGVEPDRGALPTTAGGTARDRAHERALEVLKDLETAWDGVAAFSLDVRTKAKRDIADRAESRGHGLYELKKEESRTRVHYYVNGYIRFWVGEDRYETAERVEFATDGAVLETMTLQHKHREFLRTPYSPDKLLHLGGKHLYDKLHEDYVLEVAGEEVSDARDVVLIKAIPRGRAGSSVYHFDNETGILMRLYEYDGDGEETFKMENTELNLSPEFTDDDLTFAPPENVTIIDETGPERIVIEPPKKEQPASEGSADLGEGAKEDSESGEARPDDGDAPEKRSD